MKRLEKRIKAAAYDVAAIARWGTPWPTKTRPFRSAGTITFNPKDPRARKKLIHDTIRLNIPRNRKFWNKAVDLLQPDTAIDVGVNYGECLFTARYPDTANVLGFEANPDLKPYLDQTLADHPQGKQIALHFGLVGNDHGHKADFHIDTLWSGSSSAVQHKSDTERYKTVQMPTLSIDAVLNESGIAPKRLLFKIDVEGYESFVLDGMKQTLDAAQQYVGFIEINAISAQAAGIELAEYFSRLQQQFHVLGFDRRSRLIDLRDAGIDKLEAICQKTRAGAKPRPVGTDLVLVRDADDPRINQLLSLWQ